MSGRAILLVAVLLSGMAGAWAQAPAATPVEKKLRVAVAERPPFAMKDEAGQWDGIAVELWEKLAAKLGYSYEYVELPLDQVIPELVKGDLDVAVGELVVSAERERLIDFTQPYLYSTAAVAMLHSKQRVDWKDFLEELGQHDVVSVIVGSLVLLMVFSFLLWLAERAHAAGHFGGKPIHGFGSAMWFAAVTMTTVGYGDKTPQTPVGRFLAFIWMFSGILLVSAFTGTVASAITVTRLHASVKGVSDLAHYRNGVLDGSVSQNTLGSLGIPTTNFTSISQGLTAVQTRGINTFVSDAVTLRYEAAKDFDGDFDIIPLPLAKVSFAIGTAPNSPYLQDINVALIEETNSAGWQADVNRWLGADAGQ